MDVARREWLDLGAGPHESARVQLTRKEIFVICPECSTLLPHDLLHVQMHEATCTGSTVELFLGRYMSLCESIERMALAGGPPYYSMSHRPGREESQPRIPNG